MKTIFTFIPLLLLGCSQAPKELMSDLNVDFPQTEELTQISKQDSFELYNMVNFIVKDSLLFVTEYGMDHNCRCLNINTSKEITKFINRGKANNEMLQVFDLAFYGNDSIIASGGYPRVTKTYHLNDLLQQNYSPASEVTIPKSIIDKYSYAKLRDNRIIGLVGANDELNKYYFSENDQLVFIGKQDKNLFEANRELNSEDMTSAWMPYFTAHPSNDKILTANSFGTLIEVIDPQSKSISHSKYYEKAKFEFIGDGNGMVQINCLNENIISKIGCDENQIYVVTREENADFTLENDIQLQHHLLVFDWELNPIKRYVIPSYKIGFFYIQDGYLYELVTDKDQEYYSLIKYKL